MKPHVALTLPLFMLAGCATTVPLDPPGGMSVIQARETLVRLRGDNVNAWVNTAGRTWVARGHDLVIAHDGLHFATVSIPFAAITRMSTSLDMNNKYHVSIDLTDSRNVDLVEQNVGDAVAGSSLAAAILTLKHAAAEYPDRAAAFAQAAASYHAADPKPAMTESLRQREVQAEEFVRNKQFLRAAEAYDQSLDDFPGWPQGHFNFALVLETLGDYELAAEEMQRYLTLVPDAPNARAAQDKIYQWQTHLPADNAR